MNRLFSTVKNFAQRAFAQAKQLAQRAMPQKAAPPVNPSANLNAVKNAAAGMLGKIQSTLKRSFAPKQRPIFDKKAVQRDMLKNFRFGNNVKNYLWEQPTDWLGQKFYKEQRFKDFEKQGGVDTSYGFTGDDIKHIETEYDRIEKEKANVEKQVAAGALGAQQADEWYNAEMTKLGKFVQRRQKGNKAIIRNLQTPDKPAGILSPIGTGLDFIQHSWNKLNDWTLGIPDAVTQLPFRGVNFIKNFIDPYSARYKAGTTAADRNDPQLYSKSLPKNPLDLKEMWESTKDQQLWNPQDFQSILGMSPETLGGAADFMSDPLLYAPNNWLAKSAQAANKVSTVNSLTGKISKWFNKSYDKSKLLKWANSPVPDYATRMQGKLNKLAAKGNKGLNKQDSALYSEFVRSGVIANKKVNWKKLDSFIKRRKDQYDAFIKQQWANDVRTKYRSGYVATNRGISPAEELAGRQLNSKTAKYFSDTLDSEQLARGWAIQKLQTLKAANKIQGDEALALQKLTDEGRKIFGQLNDSEIKTYQQIAKNRKLSRELSSAVANDWRSRTTQSLDRFASISRTAGKTVKGADPFRLMRNVAGAPMKLWRKSVLKYRPAWYLYNVAWNVPASFMGGGVRTAKAYFDVLRNKKLLDSMPEEVVTKGLFGTSAGGKASLGERLENYSRGATYLANIRRGRSSADSIKQVNRYLFDYGSRKNWERPMRAVFPFWNWQKNIMRLNLGLPFTNPRAAIAFKNIRQNMIEKPLQEIPEDERQAYEGKMKLPDWIPGVGGSWRTTPFLPVMPSQLRQIGYSPYLSTTKALLEGKNYYGQSTVEKPIWDTILNNFPQYQLGKNFWDTVSGKKNRERWATETGYSKEKQGFDPTKGNYNARLDPREQLMKGLEVYTGLPIFGGKSFKKFDKGEYEEDKKYGDFTTAYFGQDWKKKYPNYEERVKAQEEFAKSYGYDLQKDLYGGKWSKYDTDWTQGKKKLRQNAIETQDSIYDAYSKIPEKTGERSKFIVSKKYELANTNALDKNPYLRLFRNVPIKGTLAEMNKLFAKGSKKYDPNSAAFWQKYWALPAGEERRALLNANPQYKKFNKNYDPNKAKIAWAYENLPPDVRTNWLKKIGLYTEKTPEEWEAWRQATGNTEEDKLGRDMIRFPELGAAQLAMINQIINSWSPVKSPKGRAVSILKAWKRRT